MKEIVRKHKKALEEIKHKCSKTKCRNCDFYNYVWGECDLGDPYEWDLNENTDRKHIKAVYDDE